MKKTKKALLASVLSVVLCVSMLMGTTFAWFTDSVTSGSNRIVAGTLDVDMLYKSGTMTEYATVEGVTNTEEGVTPIFVNKDGGKILWEPGVMVYTYFDVKNLGTLALKYSFALRITGMNALKTDGVKHNLSEVVKATVLEGEIAGDEVKSAVEGAVWNSVEVFEDQNSLLASENKKFTVVLYWEPTANDNLYNVKNGQKTTTVGTFTNDDEDALYIDFDIALTATQFTYETDSFDKFYDQVEEAIIPPTWSGESEEIEYNNGGVYEVKVETETKATVTVPEGAKTEDGEDLLATDKLKLIVSPDGVDAAVKIETGNSATTYDVSLIRVSDEKKVVSDTPMIVTLDIGFVDLIRFYHDGSEYENRKATAAEVTEVGDFYYDATTGIVTFLAKHFSPFTSVYKFNGGLGTTEYPYLIATAEQFQNMTVSGKEYQLTNDIDLSSSELLTSSNTYGFVTILNRAINITIDGNDKTLTLENDEAESIFGDFKNSTLKNVKIVSTCPISGFLYGGTFDNVTVDGEMEFSNNTGIIGYYCNGANVSNCVINADVVSSSYSAVFFGYQFAGTFVVKDSEFNGTYTGPYAGLILGNGHYTSGTFTLTNVKNNGVIRALLVNKSAENPFVAMNQDSQCYAITLTYDGTQVDCSYNGSGCGFVLAGDGQYVYGPVDEGLQLTENADKTFNLTKSSATGVAYYEVEIMTNVANIGKDGGSMNISVMETITATDAASYTTKLKNFGFADGTTATYKLADTWNIITIEGTDYYLDTDPDSFADVTGTDRTWVNIRAYNKDGGLLSANIYNYD